MSNLNIHDALRFAVRASHSIATNAATTKGGIDGLTTVGRSELRVAFGPIDAAEAEPKDKFAARKMLLAYWSDHGVELDADAQRWAQGVLGKEDPTTSHPV